MEILPVIAFDQNDGSIRFPRIEAALQKLNDWTVRRYLLEQAQRYDLGGAE